MNQTDNDRKQARLVEIDDETAGQRLDNYLFRTLKGLPKSRVYRIIRKGEVRVNGRRIKPDWRLQAGDQVRIPPIVHLPDREQAVGHFHDLPGMILYESDRLLIINKPSGMAVHGGSGQQVGVIESLRHALPDGDRLELVHRLDRGTSGCLMVARRRSYLRLLQDALRKPGQIRKRYLALVHGEWPDSLTEVDQPLLTVSPTGQERVTRVDATGKPATTRFRVIARESGLTLLQASPMTGRTHQIRVHARWARHPLAGDDRYGDRLLDTEMGFSQLMLHARGLDIPALGGQPAVSVEAPLNDAFAETLRKHFKEDLNI